MMRTLLSLLLVLLMQQASHAALVGRWRLQDNAAGNWAVTATTAGSNMTLEGSAGTSSVSSLTGPGTTLTRCFLMDGVDDYCANYAVNLGLAQNKSVITLCAWIKLSTSDTTTDHRVIFFSNGTSGSTSRAVMYINTSGQIVGVARAGDAESTQSKTSSSSYDDDTWHHVAIVFDYANDAITIYVDGSSVSSTGTISFTATATSNTASSAASLCRSGSSSSNYYKGRVCDCRIYDSDESANLSTIMADAGLVVDNIDPLSISIPGSSKDPLTGTIPGL